MSNFTSFGQTTSIIHKSVVCVLSWLIFDIFHFKTLDLYTCVYVCKLSEGKICFSLYKCSENDRFSTGYCCAQILKIIICYRFER